MDGVVTFNYDTSVEQLFPVCFYYPRLSDDETKTKLPLIKLHGSLNWQTQVGSKTGSKTLPTTSAMRPIRELAEMDHGYGWYKQPEVIGPTFFKQEINLDIQDDFRARYYKDLWRFAWDKLRRASHLLFVGFSFQPTDFHASALFRTAHLSGKGISRAVLWYKKSREDRRLGSRAREVFAGGRSKVQFKECDEGLESMADRLDELIAILQH